MAHIHVPLVSVDVDGDTDVTDCGSIAAAAAAVPDWFTASLTDEEPNGISPSAVVFCMFTDSVTSTSLAAPGSLADSFNSVSTLGVGHALPLLKHKPTFTQM